MKTAQGSPKSRGPKRSSRPGNVVEIEGDLLEFSTIEEKRYICLGSLCSIFDLSPEIESQRLLCEWWITKRPSLGRVPRDRNSRFDQLDADLVPMWAITTRQEPKSPLGKAMLRRFQERCYREIFSSPQVKELARSILGVMEAEEE